jgi:hypothetical protein
MYYFHTRFDLEIFPSVHLASRSAIGNQNTDAEQQITQAMSGIFVSRKGRLLGSEHFEGRESYAR